MIQDLLNLEQQITFIKVVDFDENEELYGSFAIKYLKDIVEWNEHNCGICAFSATVVLKDNTVLHGTTEWCRGDGYDEWILLFSYEKISEESLQEVLKSKMDILNEWYNRKKKEYDEILKNTK